MKQIRYFTSVLCKFIDVDAESSGDCTRSIVTVGYEIKRAALHQTGRYDDAIQTFETMLLKMAHSPDLQIRGELDPRYRVKI